MEMFRCWVWDGACKGGGGVTLAGKRSIMGVLSCGLGRGGEGLGRGGRGVVSGYFSGLGNDGKG